MQRPFTKYEGLGNDFIVLDAAHWPLADVTPALARALCDRHTGVGGDGVLWIESDAAGGAGARLVILNADGSRPEMCGNGVRCVAAYLHHEGRLAAGAELALATDAGPRPARLLSAEGATATVEVDMGPLHVAGAPVTVSAPGGAPVRATPADAGNPHAVVFDPVAPAEREPVVRALEARRDVFPHGVNVEFVAEEANAGGPLRVRVHERGVGWTRACGTGACAVAAAAVSAHLRGAREGEPVEVLLDGGALAVTVAREGGAFRARMRGPARRAFRGVVDVDASASDAGAARPERG